MKKMIALILLLGVSAIPAQAVTWSMAGVGATYIPLVNVYTGGQFFMGLPMNNTVFAEVDPTSPGKEFLDLKANETQTGFVPNATTGLPGAGTITRTHQARIYSSKGKLLFNEPRLVKKFSFPAGRWDAFVDDQIGIANVGAVKYAVSSMSADLHSLPAPAPTPGGGYTQPQPLIDTWLQVTNLTTKKRVKVLHYKSTAKSFWKLVLIQVVDVNGDGNDDLVTRYEHVNTAPGSNSTRVFTIVRNLLTGAPIRGGYSLYTL